jgi:hypothetical protein
MSSLGQRVVGRGAQPVLNIAGARGSATGGGISLDFFHLNALSSAVAMKVDFDVLLTVIAMGLYRRFAATARIPASEGTPTIQALSRHAR